MLTENVGRLASTDRGKLGDLYLGHADNAVRLAYLLTGDLALAEDLVQTAFVRLAGRLVHLRDPAAFDSYLRKMVVNLSRSHFRRRKVERAHLERTRGAITTQVTNPWTDRPVEERDRLWRALGRLTKRQRAAVVLRYYEHLSEGRVAEIR